VRQAPRDAILACNEEGLDGLDNAPRSGRPRKLDGNQLVAETSRIASLCAYPWMDKVQT